MDKKYAFNSLNRTKLFCKIHHLPTSVVAVDFYLPKSGFSVIWVKKPLVKINDVRDTCDGRKCIVSFLIHPSYIIGKDFDNPAYNGVQYIINEIFTNYIKIL